VITAINPDFAAVRELIVHSDELQIDQFIVHPPAAFGLTRATIYWRARADTTRLFHGDVEVPGFPGTDRGSIELELAPPTFLIFVAITRAYEANIGWTFDPPQDEFEPNDLLNNGAYLYNLAAAGTLAAGDVDSYVVFFDRPTSVSVYTLNRSSDGCAVDSTIAVYDEELVELGRHHGGGPPSATGECVLAVPEEQTFLRDLTGATHFSLFSELGETGEYLMLVAIQPN
jgi:hypothetical protein